EYNSYYAISYGPALFLNLPGPPRNPLKGHHLVVPATTRSFPSSVAVLVAPYELQPAPSMLQHKPPYTKTYPKTYFDPGLTHSVLTLPSYASRRRRLLYFQPPK
ncbi:hypothetical protein F5877DRAFT_86681, partial [Lentinula edodes]